MPKEKAPWPECYYQEKDAQKRLALLQEAIQAGEGDETENAIRKKLWGLRYGQQPKKNAPLPDGYVGLWVALNYHRQDRSYFRLRSAVREIEGRLRDLGIDSMRDTEQEQQLLHRELVHAVSLYLSTCNEGSYSTQVFGLMKMKQENLVQKIAAEIYDVTCDLPARLGLAQQLQPLRKAAFEAFYETFPDHAELLEETIAGGEAQ